MRQASCSGNCTSKSLATWAFSLEPDTKPSKCLCPVASNPNAPRMWLLAHDQAVQEHRHYVSSSLWQRCTARSYLRVLMPQVRMSATRWDSLSSPASA
jgi:hypothetical protein